jgi:hypothetical protein
MTTGRINQGTRRNVMPRTPGERARVAYERAPAPTSTRPEARRESRRRGGRGDGTAGGLVAGRPAAVRVWFGVSAADAGTSLLLRSAVQDRPRPGYSRAALAGGRAARACRSATEVRRVAGPRARR